MYVSHHPIPLIRFQGQAKTDAPETVKSLPEYSPFFVKESPLPPHVKEPVSLMDKVVFKLKRLFKPAHAMTPKEYRLLQLIESLQQHWEKGEIDVQPEKRLENHGLFIHIKPLMLQNQAYSLTRIDFFGVGYSLANENLGVTIGYNKKPGLFSYKDAKLDYYVASTNRHVRQLAHTFFERVWKQIQANEVEQTRLEKIQKEYTVEKQGGLRY